MDPQELLEAHVRFELSRWGEDALDDTVTEEVVALFDWLATVPVRDLVPPDVTARLLRHAAATALSDSAARAGVLAAVGSALGTDVPEETTVADLVDRAEFDRVVDVVSSWDAVRDDIIRQVTTSQAYANLIAHVLYSGLKNYVLTENVVARKVPGASSLVRLGQSAVRTAAPRLERGIDRQLTSFVEANITDSIRDSRRYLSDALDPETVRTVADEVWRANSERDVAPGESPVPAADVETIAAVCCDVLLRAIRSEPGHAMLGAGVDAWYAEHGDQPVADVLADGGVTVESVLPDLLAAVGPALAVARDTGYLEARIRARLEPFYASLAGH